MSKLKTLFHKDENGREINLYHYKNCQLTGENLYYPNCQLYSNELINPVDERVMSLLNVNVSKKEYILHEIKHIEKTPVFYFVYNTDNYYHFIYDTLPYLISFFELRKEIPHLKLLMNYPNVDKKEHYRFVTEFLELLSLNKDFILICNENTLYENIYTSSSYTHGHDSNLPPRKEIYELYDLIKSKVPINENLPKKIYISRRTWVSDDLSNIGTNYTTRRKLQNEDQLTEYLLQKGYTEIFTEKLDTITKIQLFNNAESVIGSMGGGLCNVLFSNKDTKLIAIVSPYFLDINKRFTHSFSRVNTFYFTHTFHVEKDSWKKYMRVKYKDIVGEIVEVKLDTLVISFTNKTVAGWNSNMKLNKIEVIKNKCIPLDNGLNSSWYFDIEKLGEFYEQSSI